MASFQVSWGENHPQLPYIGDITVKELAKHNTRKDCWCSLKGYVYNLTSYLDVHPGGAETILKCAGGDMTEDFMKAHRWISPSLISKVRIGRLVK